MNKKVWSLPLLVLLFLITGCWDYTEIEKIDFILGVGVEQVEQDFELVIEAIKTDSSKGSTELQPVVLTSKGETFFGTARNLSNPAGKRLFWAHAHLVIVSEEVARSGIMHALESAVRDPDLRTSIWLFVTKDCTVEEVFQSKPPFAGFVTDHLEGIIESRHRIPFFIAQEIWQFRMDLAKSGIAGILPTIQLVQEGKDKIPIIEGTAVFDGDKMVDWLDGQETRFLALLRNEPDRGPLVIKSSALGQQGKLTYEIESNRVLIKPVLEEGKLKMQVELRLFLNLLESHIMADFAQVNVLEEFETEVCQTVNKELHEFLGKVQRELGIDIFGFGLMVKQKHPNFWRTHSEEWQDIFEHLTVEINTQTKIVATGVMAGAPELRD